MCLSVPGVRFVFDGPRVSVPRLRRGECPGKRGGPPRRLRPSRHQETCPLDRPGRNLPLRKPSGQLANDINPGPKDPQTHRGLGLSQFSLPHSPPPLLKASLTACGCAEVNRLQEDKVLFVLMICDPVHQELTAQG